MSTDWVDLVGYGAVALFAVSGVLAVQSHKPDVVSALIFGLLTGLGGGTVRDLIMDRQVIWSQDTTFLWVCVVAAPLAWYFASYFARSVVRRGMLLMDAAGVALVAVQAAQLGINAGFAMPLGPIILGGVTAIGGGLLRDTLAGNPNLLLRRELYLTPILIATSIYVALTVNFPDRVAIWAPLCMATSFTIRVLALRFGWALPGIPHTADS